MPWFKRTTKPSSKNKKLDIPEGVWIKCKSCGEALFRKELERNLNVCPKCDYHFRLSSGDYLDLLLDKGSWEEHDAELRSTDPLEFKDSIKYRDRMAKYEKKAGIKDAVRCVSGKMNERDVEMAVMDFTYMGGSVGSVVGEKICRSVTRAIEARSALVTVSCSGGMRMQEGAYSLMQMAKVSAALTLLSKAEQPFISLITDPTTGGTTASFSMLGDVIISEPGALIGFAGARVIKQTIGQDLPEGFQSAEFLLEHGFLDMIVSRKDLKSTITKVLGLLKPQIQR